jgi:hypothetical protein
VVSPESTVPQGTILIRDGLIEAVGENINIPADARIFNAKGLIVYPGLIDGATHFGFAAPARTTGPAPVQTTPPDATADEPNSPDRYLRPKAIGMNADWSAASRMTVPSQPDARRNMGFTTVLSVPRDGYWQGKSALVNLAGGANEAIVLSQVAMHVSFTSNARGQYPTALMGVFAALRQSLLTAQQYTDAVKLYESSGRRGIARPRFDPVSAALQPVLEGKMPVVFRANSAEEIRRALRFADEFKLRSIILGASKPGAWPTS